MRAASPLRQIERENEMIVISHRLFLHAEDIGMRACVNQRQCENIILNQVNQKPVRLHMTFPKSQGNTD